MLNSVHLIWLAGAVQLAMVAMNAALPPRMNTRENLARVEPIVMQVFYSQWVFVMLAVTIFGIACFALGADMAGNSAMGRFLSATMALFWLLKPIVQLMGIDKGFRRRHRLADLLVALGTIYLVGFFGAAASRLLQ